MKKGQLNSKGKILNIIDTGFFLLIDSKKLTKESTEYNDHNSKVYVYTIMPRLGKNLDYVFKKRNCNFTKEQICSLGIQIINILE